MMFVVHPGFRPLPGRLTFFVLPKKVSKERRARDGAKLQMRSLNFRNQAEKDRNSLRSDSGPSFFRPLTEIQGAI